MCDNCVHFHPSFHQYENSRTRINAVIFYSTRRLRICTKNQLFTPLKISHHATSEYTRIQTEPRAAVTHPFSKMVCPLTRECSGCLAHLFYLLFRHRSRRSCTQHYTHFCWSINARIGGQTAASTARRSVKSSSGPPRSIVEFHARGIFRRDSDSFEKSQQTCIPARCAE